MSKSDSFEILNQNRFLRTPQEIQAFESALQEIAQKRDASYFPSCTLF
jgi:hypothetical protein